MLISGLAKLTLLDYPGHTACTVFTGGCNFRCPFCHNARLVERGFKELEIPEEEVFDHLKKRVGVLDGVAITGGEPLLHADIGDFISRVKEMDYAVKLDTNGSFPDRLRDLVERGLVDYVAMDIKNSPQKYAATVGVPGLDLAPINESVEFLKSGAVEHEFRTTVVREFHCEEDFREIGRWIEGDHKYFLQAFSDSGELLEEGLHGVPKPEMEAFAAAAAEFLPHVELRGVD